MPDYDQIRDAMHSRLAAARICTPFYLAFLRDRQNIPSLIEQLIRNMEFVLEEGHISESELITLLEDPKVDLSPVHGDVLAWAVKSCRLSFLAWFLERFDLSQHYPEALHSAAQSGDGEIVTALIGGGADVSALDNAALRYAAFRGHLDVVRMLVEAGADPGARKHEAARLAGSEGHGDIVSYLTAEVGTKPQ